MKREAGPKAGLDDARANGTASARCGCSTCWPAIPRGQHRDDPEAAARVVRAAWAARVALAEYRRGERR
jgi:hypothetical protein